jgi:hypothetical protein
MIYFNAPIESELDGKNVFMSYYKVITNIDSDSDILDEPDTDMFISYLKYKIKDRKTRGKIKIDEDSDYAEYTKRKIVQIRKELPHQGVGFSPSIGHLTNAE